MDSFYQVTPMERRTWKQKHGIGSMGHKEEDWRDDFFIDLDATPLKMYHL